MKFVGMLLLIVVGCTRGRPTNTLRYPIESEPPTLDSTAVHDHVSFEVLYNLVEGLTKYDENMRTIPALAERWEVSKDRKTYTFFLRDAKWSDGVPVRAQDFVFAWRRLLDPKRAAEYAYFLFDIENAEAFNQGKITDPNLIGVRALDNSRLEVRLQRPTSYFLQIPTLQVTAPQREDIVTQHPNDFTEPNYFRATGPFRLRKWEHDSKIVLETNPYYYGEKSQITQVEFLVVKEDSTALNMYERGELDIAFRIPALELDRVKGRPDYRREPVLRGYYYGFNVTLKPFDNPLVRKAFAMAINRDELMLTLRGGQIPTTSWVPRGMFGYESGVGLKYDPKGAQELLAKAGYPGGKRFPKVTMMYDSLELNKTVAERLQYAWKTVLGIPEIEIVTQEWKVYLDTITHNAPMIWRMGWGGDYPDPHTFMDLFTSNSGNNSTHWKNARYDALIAKGATSSDAIERLAVYKKAQKLLLEEEAVIIPLFQTATEMLVKPYVTGFYFDPIENPHFSKAKIQLSR